MSSQQPQFAKPAVTAPKRWRSRSRTLRLLRNRLIAGLFVALPIFITFVILAWIYQLLVQYIIGPVGDTALKVIFQESEPERLSWFLQYILGRLIAVVVILIGLVFLGMFFRSRLHRFVNWVLLNVPGVSAIYAAVSKVFDAVQSMRSSGRQFKRTVLIQFPHPGCKAPAFVTSECIDTTTGRTILCVYVPTTPVPTSGYMLLIPQEDVIDLEWSLQETLQAIVSGGITVPETVTFVAGPQSVVTVDPQLERDTDETPEADSVFAVENEPDVAGDDKLADERSPEDGEVIEPVETSPTDRKLQ